MDLEYRLIEPQLILFLLCLNFIYNFFIKTYIFIDFSIPLLFDFFLYLRYFGFFFELIFLLFLLLLNYYHHYLYQKVIFFRIRFHNHQHRHNKFYSFFVFYFSFLVACNNNYFHHRFRCCYCFDRQLAVIFFSFLVVFSLWVL